MVVIPFIPGSRFLIPPSSGGWWASTGAPKPPSLEGDDWQGAVAALQLGVRAKSSQGDLGGIRYQHHLVGWNKDLHSGKLT